MKTVLVTGGAGYVGSHCAKAFAAAGWTVVTLDNLSRGWRDAVRWGPLIEGDIADRALVASALEEYRPDLVAHFAAYAYVGESVEQPELYYRNNSAGTLALLEEMLRAGVNNLLFSSTCASYGIPTAIPIDETHPQAPINPYGWSKYIIERMLGDLHTAHGFNSVSLRYFNAAGCDPDGELGERHEPETHIIPLAIQAAIGKGPALTINGEALPTRDGTAVRDYIHVADLARAHVLAAEKLLRDGGLHIYNLGTGTGTTIKELVESITRLTGSELPHRYGPPRPGDPPALVASAEKARAELGWVPEHSAIDNIVSTALAWFKRQ